MLLGGNHYIDVIILVIVYLCVIYKENTAILFAFFLGLFTDTYSACIFGSSSFIYLCVYISIWLLSNFIDIHTKTGNMVTVLLALLIKELLFFSIAYVFVGRIPKSISFLRSSISCIMLTTLFSPFIFNLLAKLKYDKNG